MMNQTHNVMMELLDQLQAEKKKHSEMQILAAATLRREFALLGKLDKIRHIADDVSGGWDMQAILEIIDA